MSKICTLIIGPHGVGIEIQNAVVSPKSLGLVNDDIGAIRIKSFEMDKELYLSKYAIPAIGLCVGYPDDNPGIKPRIPMNGIFFEDKYGTEKAKADFDVYDNIFKNIYLKGKLMLGIAICLKVVQKHIV